MGIRTKLQEMRLERLVGVGSVVGEVEGDTGNLPEHVLLEEGDLAQIKRTTHRGAATPHRESRDPADDFPGREAGEMRLLLDEFRRKPRRRAQRSLDGHSAVLR